MSQYDNQDYYKVGGRSNGPAGTLDQFKKQVSRSRSVIGRDQERVLPGERPRAGIKRGGPGGKGGKKASALSGLPKAVGTAGVTSRSKAPTTKTAAQLEDLRKANRAMAEAEAELPVTGYEDVASPTPSEAWSPELPGPTAARAANVSAGEETFGVPASEERLGTGEANVVPSWLWPALRPFRPAMRLIGGAARLLDPPVRYTLDVMQRVGRLAHAEPRRT